jgi:hypothetical protein
LEVDGVELALFYTKNGLPYPGLLCTRRLRANEIFIRVPEPLLLTTRLAYFSDIQQIFDENKQVFHWNYFSDWEDRIFLAFLLYEHQKGPKSPWLLLISNLPKEIDLLCCWSPQEQTLLEDPRLAREGSKTKQSLE